MIQIWFKTFNKERLVDSVIINFDDQPNLSDIATEACNKFDYPSPVILNKHEKEFKEFNITGFSKGDFMETVPFEKMEIEYVPIEEDSKELKLVKKRAR